MGGSKMDGKRLTFLFLLILLFASCRSTKYVPVERTVVEKITTTDTVVEYQLVPYRDSVAIDDTASFLYNDYGYSWAVFSDGQLRHSLVIWPNKPILIEIPKTVIEKQVTEPTYIEVERKKTFWEKAELFILRVWFIVTFLMIAVIAAYLLIKKYKKGTT